MTGPSDAMIEAAKLRHHLAWLLWCVDQGYTNPEDRAILSNWLLDDPTTLTKHDADLRVHLLGMADEILAAVLPLVREQIAEEIDTHAGHVVNGIREGVSAWAPERAIGYTAAISEVLELLDGGVS